MGNFKEGWREQGHKQDQGKTRYDLIPPEALRLWAEVLTFGEDKYEARNWEKGIEYGRVYAALIRHIQAWVEGETNDPETGLPHLAHAMCCLTFLLTYDERGMNLDFDNLRRNMGYGDIIINGEEALNRIHLGPDEPNPYTFFNTGE